MTPVSLASIAVMKVDTSTTTLSATTHPGCAMQARNGRERKGYSSLIVWILEGAR